MQSIEQKALASALSGSIIDHDELNPLELQEALGMNFSGQPDGGDAQVLPPTLAEGGRAISESLSGALPATTPPSAVEEEKIEARPYYGQENFPAQYTLQKEEPQHRVICYLAAQGNTTTEIAEYTGFTTAMVAYVKKQPWAQKQIAEIQEKNGAKIVKEMFQGAAVKVAQALIDIATDKVPSIHHDSAVRSRSANSILDRLYGKAPETINHREVDETDLTREQLEAIILAGKN